MAPGMQEECLGGLFLAPPLPSSPGEASKALSQLGTGLRREMVWVLNIPGAGVFSRASGGCMREGRPGLLFDVGDHLQEAAWISLPHSHRSGSPQSHRHGWECHGHSYLTWCWQGRGLCFGLKCGPCVSSFRLLSEVRVLCFLS